MSEVEFYAVIEHIDDISADEIVKNNFHPRGIARLYPTIESVAIHEYNIRCPAGSRKQLMKITGNVQLRNLENDDAKIS
jgi:hypothetical protein